MIIFANASGAILKTDPERVFQGSNLAGTIYFAAPYSINTSVRLSFSLPDGTVTEEYPMVLSGGIPELSIAEKGITLWEWSINSSVTQLAGQVTLQFGAGFYDNSGIFRVQKTSSTSFTVEKGVIPLPPESPGENVYDMILANQAKLDANIYHLATQIQIQDSQIDNLLLPPDNSEANLEGDPTVSITDDGRFKFAYLKGQRGLTGAAGANAFVEWGINEPGRVYNVEWRKS